MVIEIVGGVYRKENRDDGGVFKTVGVPIKIMVTGGDGVEGGTKGGDMNQVSNRPVLLEASKNIIIGLVSMQVNWDDGSWSTHTVAG